MAQTASAYERRDQTLDRPSVGWDATVTKVSPSRDDGFLMVDQRPAQAAEKLSALGGRRRAFAKEGRELTIERRPEGGDRVGSGGGGRHGGLLSPARLPRSSEPGSPEDRVEAAELGGLPCQREPAPGGADIAEERLLTVNNEHVSVGLSGEAGCA